MPKVIVVPETDAFTHDVSHRDLVWINSALGVPQLEGHETWYVAPYWLGDDEGVERIYHILSVDLLDDATELRLGNSFVLDSPWTGLSQHRRFEYHDLIDFGFVEIRPGLLLKVISGDSNTMTGAS